MVSRAFAGHEGQTTWSSPWRGPTAELESSPRRKTGCPIPSLTLKVQRRTEPGVGPERGAVSGFHFRKANRFLDPKHLTGLPKVRCRRQHSPNDRRLWPAVIFSNGLDQTTTRDCSGITPRVNCRRRGHSNQDQPEKSPTKTVSHTCGRMNVSRVCTPDRKSEL